MADGYLRALQVINNAQVRGGGGGGGQKARLEGPRPTFTQLIGPQKGARTF